MGIYIFTDRLLDKRDKYIQVELLGKITTLESDITWLKEQVAAKVERIDELKQQYEPALARYKELQAAFDGIQDAYNAAVDEKHALERTNAELEQTLADKEARITALIEKLREPDAKITDLSARLGMAHEVEANQAEVIATQKQTIADLSAKNEEFEQAYGEYGLLSDETVLFLKRIATGANIKRDQTGGKELIARAKELLLQYGHGEKPVTGDTQ